MHKAIIQEHFQIKSLVKKLNIELLISDARLGAAQKDTPSVIISHHLHFPLAIRFFEWWSDNWMRFFYQRFDQLWIPDYPGEKNISGVLAHGYKSKKAYFVGPLSRFKKLELNKKYDIAVVLSGPEPQRTYLEQALLKELSTLEELKIIFIRGVKEKLITKLIIPSFIEMRELVFSDELNEIMCSADNIICRSGYTSLLDLAVIQKKAIIIPTPGQPEQIYLAETLLQKKIFLSTLQDNLDLKNQLNQLADYPGFSNDFETIKLNEKMEELLAKLSL